jgi:DNA processing protein
MTLAWVTLNAIKGLGPVKINQLIDEFGTPEEVINELSKGKSRLAGGLEGIRKQLQSSDFLAAAEKQLTIAEQANVSILTLSDADYPSSLKQIFAPPPVLYVKGLRTVFTHTGIAIVGTRKPTHYGETAALQFSRDFALAGLVVVSGLALGIDAIAHKACLDAGGETIAVLGSGLDYIHPVTNRPIADRIINHGALVSEFPFGIHPEPYNFPRRNRIISGLSAGVVVVEAGKRSGALVTADYAIQHGRDVFAVPGSIFSEKADGVNGLLKNGALLIKNAREAIESIKTISLSQVTTNLPPADTRERLSESERMVLEAIDSEPLRMDQVAEKSRKMISELFNLLLNLELKGYIRQVAGQQYVKV